MDSPFSGIRKLSEAFFGSPLPGHNKKVVRDREHRKSARRSREAGLPLECRAYTHQLLTSWQNTLNSPQNCSLNKLTVHVHRAVGVRNTQVVCSRAAPLLPCSPVAPPPAPP
jgi:hypothetical protein